MQHHSNPRTSLVFVNPPYGRELKAWAEKMVSERHCAIVALVPCRTDTAWWNILDPVAVCATWSHQLLRQNGPTVEASRAVPVGDLSIARLAPRLSIRRGVRRERACVSEVATQTMTPVTLSKLHRRATALCYKYGLPSDAADDAIQIALLSAVEKGARNIWTFAYASLNFAVAHLGETESRRQERETRYSENGMIRQLGDDERLARHERQKVAQAARWVGHEILKKSCENCAKEFAAVDSKGASDKDRRFCSKTCANRYAAAGRATTRSPRQPQQPLAREP